MYDFYLAQGQNLEGRLVEITGYLRSGKKIQAIKVYRAVTGAPLAEAKDAIDRLDLAIKLYGTMAVADAIMEGTQQGMPVNMDIQSM